MKVSKNDLIRFGVLTGLGLAVIFASFLQPAEVPESTPSEITQSFEDPHQRSRELIAAGDLETAESMWQRIVADQPENADAFFNLGLITAVLQPADAPIFFSQAAKLDEDLGFAVSQYQNALRRASFAAEPAHEYIQIGQVLAAADEWFLAKYAFENAVALNTEYAEGWAFLGEAQQQIGEDGFPALQRAIRLQPLSLSANLMMGIYFNRQHEPNKALLFFDLADQIDPENPAIWTEIANTYAEIGEIQTALEYFLNLIEFAPDNPQSWLTLAQFSLDHEIQVEQVGLAAATQAVFLLENDPAALTLLGRAYALLDNPENAQEFLHAAIELNTNYAPAHYYLGLHYLTQGISSQARRHLLAASDLEQGEELGAAADELLKEYFP